MQRVVRMAVILLLPVAMAVPTDAIDGFYYPTPSWDQKLPAATRFIVLSNWGGAAVLDRETGLVWEQSPDPTTRSWAAAHIHCNELSVGNRKGWRVPTVQELASLVDPTVPSPGPTIPPGHPFSFPNAGFWSATTNFVQPGNAWIVGFIAGGLLTNDKLFPPIPVWCVRGGQGVDPQ